MSASEIAARARDLAPAERAAWIVAACAGNAALRKEVEALLRPTPSLTATIATGDEGGKTSIGPYQIVRQLGEGGMGVVYQAQQREPLRREVALKIIKPGMDSRRIISRFESERQALAIMDHANIASVLDAGTTEAG